LERGNYLKKAKISSIDAKIDISYVRI